MTFAGSALVRAERALEPIAEHKSLTEWPGQEWQRP